MNKKLLIGIIVVVVVAVVIVGYFLIPKKTAKVYQVGILSGDDAFLEAVDGFKAKMTELGYIEGKNIVYDLQKVNNDPTGEQQISEKFVADKVDLIFALPTSAALSAKAATQGTNIPVVFSVAMIEGSNLVENVRQPGGNITGVRFPGPDMTIKRLEFLHQLVPQAKRIYVTYDANYPSIPYLMGELNKAASSMNVKLVEAPVTTVEEIKADLKTRAASPDIGIDAVLTMPTLLTAFQGFGEVVKFAAEHRLPVIGIAAAHINMGAVLTFDPSISGMGALSASSADKVIKGMPAGTIPVVTPEGELYLNYKIAQELGLTVPEELLSRAREIIR